MAKNEWLCDIWISVHCLLCLYRGKMYLPFFSWNHFLSLLSSLIFVSSSFSLTKSLSLYFHTHAAVCNYFSECFFLFIIVSLLLLPFCLMKTNGKRTNAILFSMLIYIFCVAVLLLFLSISFVYLCVQNAAAFALSAHIYNFFLLCLLFFRFSFLSKVLNNLDFEKGKKQSRKFL